MKCWWWFYHSIFCSFYTLYQSLKLFLIDRPKWRARNKHNYTTIEHAVDFSRINVWNYTYWELDIRFWPEYDNSYIYIWNYCLIADDVIFLCWDDHNIKTMFNYPIWSKWFKYFWRVNRIKKYSKLNYSIEDYGKIESMCKWPIIVDDDVRIWTWAKIMSWVHIWQWAVIAAWAVVTKDIPPYAIAWWVPAKVIKYRFTEDKIKKLLQIDYSNIPIERFREIYPEIIKEDFNIDTIQRYSWR